MENVTLAYAAGTADRPQQFRRIASAAFIVALAIWAEAWGTYFTDLLFYRVLGMSFEFPKSFYIVGSPLWLSPALIVWAIWMFPISQEGTGRGRSLCMGLALVALLLRVGRILTFGMTATYAWAAYSAPYPLDSVLDVTDSAVVFLQVVLMVAGALYVRRIGRRLNCRRFAAIGLWILLLAAALQGLALVIELPMDLGVWPAARRTLGKYFNIVSPVLGPLKWSAAAVHLAGWLLIGIAALYLARKSRGDVGNVDVR